MNKTLEAIVISVRDYREQDAILSVLCKEEGVQSLVARGIRKLSSKNAGSCQPFVYGKFYVDFHEQKTIHSMRTVDVIQSHRRIREDLEKQAIASVLCECMEKAEMEAADAFPFLLEALRNLQETQEPYGLLALYFSCMNAYHGIEPYVDGCVHCQTSKGIAGVSVLHGGFVCTAHLDPQHDLLLGKDDLRRFRLLCKAQFKQFPLVEEVQGWTYAHFMLVYRFFEEYSGIRLKSMRFLNCLQEMQGGK